MTRIALSFLAPNDLQRAASGLAARYVSVAEAQRAEADIVAFADDQVQRRGAQIDAEASVGAPSNTDLPDRRRFEDGLTAMLARAERLMQDAATVDAEVATALGDLRQQSRAHVARVVGPSGAMGALSALLGLAFGASPEPTSAEGLPPGLRNLIVDAAVGLVESRSAEALASTITRRVDELRGRSVRWEHSVQALRKALADIQRDAGNPRVTRRALPIDLVLDDDRAAGRLLRGLPRTDWSDVLGRADGLDAGSARRLVEQRVADIVADVAQRPIEVLASLLLERSVEDSLDTMVRNGSPLAPLRPREVPDGCMGLAVGIPEASSRYLLEMLGESLGRAQDIVEYPKAPRLADETRDADIAGSSVRYLGVLTVEAISAIVTDLYEHGSGPGLGQAAARDWELDEDLPALMTQARLCREIASRKVRGQRTARLERWLDVPFGQSSAAVDVQSQPPAAPPGAFAEDEPPVVGQHPIEAK